MALRRRKSAVSHLMTSQPAGRSAAQRRNEPRGQDESRDCGCRQQTDAPDRGKLIQQSMVGSGVGRNTSQGWHGAMPEVGNLQKRLLSSASECSVNRLERSAEPELHGWNEVFNRSHGSLSVHESSARRISNILRRPSASPKCVQSFCIWLRGSVFVVRSQRSRREQSQLREPPSRERSPQ